jgi:hypothetical protein
MLNLWNALKLSEEEKYSGENFLEEEKNFRG